MSLEVVVFGPLRYPRVLRRGYLVETALPRPRHILP